MLPPPATHRPNIMGSHYMASSGHYLATTAAVRILEAGGNAIDAGVAAGLCLNVVQPEFTNLGGVAPIILYSARDDVVRTISGLGCWPSAVSTDYFTIDCGGAMPPGVQRSVMPAAIDAWLTALKLFGTRPLAEVAAPAIALAEEGFPVNPLLHANLVSAAETMTRWPSSTAVFHPGGRLPQIGERLVQRDLARTLRLLVEAEASNHHLGREGAIQAARDRFYTGDIAERIAAFIAGEGGFLALDDLIRFSVDVESPVRTTYRGYDVFGCGPWSQGPVALETLAILEGYDLASLGHNSAEALHLILEALKAGFADRERYYGDPKFVDVPLDGLLHPDYASTWRDRIDPERAAPGMPAPGDPWAFEARDRPATAPYVAPDPLAAPVKADTSYVCVVDAAGNAFSATPSDGVGESPIVPGLGFVVSDRGIQSRLDPNHPSAIAPGKRPRLTPNPGLIMRDGRVVAPYGTPGGDVQPQAMVQFVVNLIDFGMDPQAAIEAPRVASYSFPQSFYPYAYTPDLVMAEARLPTTVIDDLRRRGHDVDLWPDWSAAAGALCAAVVDQTHGTLLGAADPRRLAYALGW
ncbi:MAG: gamma-glutamyltranspeptidase / glutathione hydrolase [Thermomicrobiales bacterium]|nr:gamma-glutamyltranspeptidase / glutathione hydrolase [Thermomicrobiales bacterium]